MTILKLQEIINNSLSTPLRTEWKELVLKDSLNQTMSSRKEDKDIKSINISNNSLGFLSILGNKLPN